MPKIFTPTNRIRLTNVAIVRLKKGGKRFEIACYKNKVLSWRDNSETDIDEVLQTHTIFTSVSKGQMANKHEVKEIFGISDETEICKEILEKGKLQVSEKERQSLVESQLANIASSVAKLCIDPETRIPHPTSIIEKSLKKAHFQVKLNKNLKQQTLEAIKVLERIMPIARERMKLRISFSEKEWGFKLKKSIIKLATQVEHQEWEGCIVHLTIFVDPDNYRVIDELVRNETIGVGLVELVDQKSVDTKFGSVKFIVN